MPPMEIQKFRNGFDFDVQSALKLKYNDLYFQLFPGVILLLDPPR